MSHSLPVSTRRPLTTAAEPADAARPDGLQKARAPRLAALAGVTALRSASGRLVVLPRPLPAA